jgi:hypothetical protein
VHKKKKKQNAKFGIMLLFLLSAVTFNATIRKQAICDTTHCNTSKNKSVSNRAKKEKA